MAPSLFALPAFVLLFIINFALVYLCLNIKRGKKFCQAIPFFISGLFTVFIQLLIEQNRNPADGITFSKLQYLGFWSYFFTVPLLVSGLTEQEFKPWMKISTVILSFVSWLLTVFTDQIVSSRIMIYQDLYIAKTGNLYPFVATLLFIVCILSYRRLVIFANKSERPTLQFTMSIGLGLCIISGLIDYAGKLRGEPFFPLLRDAFSMGMLSASSSFGIYILMTYTYLVSEYQKALTELERFLKKSTQSFDEFVQLIAKTIDAKDKYTAGHSIRVAEYAVRIARVLNLDDRQIEILRKACFLHDIGKIGIPDGVLNKKAPLTEKERSYIYRHPIIGKEILSQMSEFQEILDVVYFHHERYDGSGYPAGLKKDEIPLLAKILAVADAYDAMLSERPYRPARSKLEAIKELLNSKGKQFDPEIVDKFIDTISRYNSFSLNDIVN